MKAFNYHPVKITRCTIEDKNYLSIRFEQFLRDQNKYICFSQVEAYLCFKFSDNNVCIGNVFYFTFLPRFVLELKIIFTHTLTLTQIDFKYI